MKFTKTMRSLHRDLGYLFIGLTLIYAVSGILVVLKREGHNPAYKEVEHVVQAKANLSPDELKTYWKENVKELPKLTRVISKNENYKIYVKGGMGFYDPRSGEIDVTTYKRIQVFKFVNDIHYNVGKRFTIIAIVFCVIMIFFAVSGAIIVKGKNGFKRRGVWLMLVGIAVPILLYIFS
ncbi:MAG: PepSY-associated TM helix domain-containing protein [Nitrosopumilus sp.]|jgi:uncharacterized iron-regulated membrane protein